MSPLESNPPKEKPAKMGFDNFHLDHFTCRCCGAHVVIKNTEHFKMLCPECDPDSYQEPSWD